MSGVLREVVSSMLDDSLTYPLHQLFKVYKDLLDSNGLLLPWKTETITGKFWDLDSTYRFFITPVPGNLRGLSIITQRVGEGQLWP
jgi:hypothetical protein